MLCSPHRERGFAGQSTTDSKSDFCAVNLKDRPSVSAEPEGQTDHQCQQNTDHQCRQNLKDRQTDHQCQQYLKDRQTISVSRT